MDKILIIEDEFSINDILTMALEREGYEVISAFDGEEGLKLFKEFKPKLVLLDLMLPDMTGEEICEKISKEAYVIMVTAKDNIYHKINGMELGADDYITKPFDIREIKVRVKSMLRRSEKEIEKVVDTGLLVDESKKLAVLDGKILDLNRKEFELIAFLFRNKGIVFSRDKLLDEIWGIDFFGDNRTVDVHVRRLRGKIGEEKGNKLIQTVFGVGYVMR